MNSAIQINLPYLIYLRYMKEEYFFPKYSLVGAGDTEPVPYRPDFVNENHTIVMPCCVSRFINARRRIDPTAHAGR